MNRSRSRTIALLAAAGLSLAGIAVYRGITHRHLPPLPAELPERTSGYYTLVGPDGDVLLRTGIGVSKGDAFIAPDNLEYVVDYVSQGVAYLRRFTPRSSSLRLAGRAFELSGRDSITRGFEYPRAVPAIPLGAGRKLIVLYHTHSDESYAPTSGSSNIPGEGDILRVGGVLADALRAEGFRVIQDRTRHDPHDAAAYDRSRRTVFNYLSRGPFAIFDVHRDAGPPSGYRADAGGRVAARILLVVGQANPFVSANRAFAERVKRFADANYPDLIRGILLAAGGYNQDLDPASLLLEIGTDAQRLSEAEEGARLFATVMSRAFPTGP